MQSQPATARPGDSILSNLPNFSTANHLSWGTVTQQLVQGRQPFSWCDIWPRERRGEKVVGDGCCKHA